MTIPGKKPAKVALITGANSGIGRVTAISLAQQGYQVFLACRSLERTQPVLDEIAKLPSGSGQASWLDLDLADLDSVRGCAEDFLSHDLPLDLLILNAGLAGHKGLTRAGFEMTFGVCHIGHFLLTQLLLPRVKQAAPARIVVVASRAHRYIRRLNFAPLTQPTRGITGFLAYSVAKLCNVLFASELARRLKGTGVTVYALHPGVVSTEVWRKVPWPFDKLMKSNMISEEQGAATTLYCATDPTLANETGAYYADCKRLQPTALAQDQALAQELWRRSEAWVANPPLRAA